MTKIEFENLKLNDKVYIVDRKGCCVYTGKVDSFSGCLISINHLRKIIDGVEIEVNFNIGTDYKHVYTSNEEAMRMVRKL